MAQDRDQWLGFVNTAVNLRIPEKLGNNLTLLMFRRRDERNFSDRDHCAMETAGAVW